jgi:hypothetical protein
LNKQDEKKFYMGMVLLGLLVRGTPVSGIPEMAQALVKELMEKENK